MTVWRVENDKADLTVGQLKEWARALKTSAAELIA
jgi:hypothetical protein